jgi:hypothetical protein
MLHCHASQAAQHTRFLPGFALTAVSTVVSPAPCVHGVGGGGAHRRHPARVVAEGRPDSSLAREVLDVLRMNATTEHDGEAAMPLLIPF